MSILTYNFESEYLKNNHEVTVILPDKPRALTPEEPAICLEHNIPPPPGWRGGRRVLNALYLCISGRSPGLY